MITAAARTNAIGKVSALSEIGVTHSLDQFKIETSGRGSKPFCEAGDLRSREGKYKLGDLLSGHGDKLEIIARAMFENGMPLTLPVCVMVNSKNRVVEVWDESTRFKVDRGRVYSKRRRGRRCRRWR